MSKEYATTILDQNCYNNNLNKKASREAYIISMKPYYTNICIKYSNKKYQRAVEVYQNIGFVSHDHMRTGIACTLTVSYYIVHEKIV